MSKLQITEQEILVSVVKKKKKKWLWLETNFVKSWAEHGSFSELYTVETIIFHCYAEEIEASKVNKEGLSGQSPLSTSAAGLGATGQRSRDADAPI